MDWVFLSGSVSGSTTSEGGEQDGRARPGRDAVRQQKVDGIDTSDKKDYVNLAPDAAGTVGVSVHDRTAGDSQT